MIVRFNYIEEFVDELRKDSDLIERRIVRVTNELRPVVAGLTAVLVVATAVVEGNVIRLEHRCGETFSGDADEQAAFNSRAVVGELRKILGGMDIEIRAGVFQEAAA